MLEASNFHVLFYENQVSAAEQELKAAQERLNRRRERLTAAQETLKDLREQFAEETTRTETGRFAGMRLREAAVLVIKEAGGKAVALATIIQTLNANGYPFNTRYPGRALHAALIGVSDVEKPGGGTYRWRHSPPDGSPTRPNEVAAGDN